MHGDEEKLRGWYDIRQVNTISLEMSRKDSDIVNKATRSVIRL